MENKFVILIDGENISYKYYNTIINKINKAGQIIDIKIYADWLISNMKGWKKTLETDYMAKLIHVSGGKDATDDRIKMEAAAFIERNCNVNSFCIATSDCGFRYLPIYLREHGKYVIGMGEKKSPQILRNTCNKFIILENNQYEVILKKPVVIDEISIKQKKIA
jgi:Zn-finger protein